jgi:hypothetical protein
MEKKQEAKKETLAENGSQGVGTQLNYLSLLSR